VLGIEWPRREADGPFLHVSINIDVHQGHSGITKAVNSLVAVQPGMFTGREVFPQMQLMLELVYWPIRYVKAAKSGVVKFGTRDPSRWFT